MLPAAASAPPLAPEAPPRPPRPGAAPSSESHAAASAARARTAGQPISEFLIMAPRVERSNDVSSFIGPLCFVAGLREQNVVRSKPKRGGCPELADEGPTLHHDPAGACCDGPMTAVKRAPAMGNTGTEGHAEQWRRG